MGQYVLMHRRLSSWHATVLSMNVCGCLMRDVLSGVMHVSIDRGEAVVPYRHAEPQDLMAVPTWQKRQDDGDGDQDNDDPLQHFHPSSGGLIGHLSIDALKCLQLS